MSRRSERGVALVAAVTTLAILGVLGAGLAYTSAVDLHLTRNALMALQADALARSGVAVAAVLLEEAAATAAPDTLAAPWARDSGRQALGPGWVEVHVEDEARRLDLNAPELTPAVPRLLATLGLDPALADTLADWTDADDVPRPLGAERGWYLGLTPPREPRNGPLASLGELALIRGFDAPTLARLRPYVTVAGEPRVNPNTAPREVLMAVLGDSLRVERILNERQRGPIEPSDAWLTARGQHYTARVVAGVGELRRGVEATLWALPGIPAEITAWRSFVPDA